jgi:hypothetical protein
MRSTAWDRDNACVLCQADLVTGLRDLSPGMNVELTPTLTGSKAAERGGADDAPLVARPADGEIGLDARWGVTSDLTLNLTVNPDFSQVEADVAQLDVNNRFALFFPEKRPFFLEGADFFGTPIRAVFTRSIVEPVAGVKLTGKLGASALGLLVARDRATNLLLPGSQSSVTEVVDAPVTTAIARFRRDVGGSSTVGALATAREGAGYHNRVGGMDAYYRPVGALTLQGQALGSVTRYPASIVAARGTPADAFTGYAASGSAQWSTRDWLVYADGRVLDDGFRADAGFQAQAGVRGGSLNVTRRIWGGADRWFTQLRLEGGTWHNEDFDGNPLGRGMWVGLGYDGPGQVSVGLWPNLFMSEHFDGVTYDGMNQLWFDLRAAPRGSLSLGLNGNLGDAIDFAHGRPGSELRLAPVVDVRLGRNVEGGLRHTYQRLTVDGAPVFTANLSQLRAVYNFSPRSFVRAVVQYRRTDRDPLLFADPVDRRSVAVLGQGLFAYKVNPQTVFFLGYGEDGNGSIGVDDGRVPFETRARALFLKVGYAWRP